MGPLEDELSPFDPIRAAGRVPIGAELGTIEAFFKWCGDHGIAGAAEKGNERQRGRAEKSGPRGHHGHANPALWGRATASAAPSRRSPGDSEKKRLTRCATGAGRSGGRASAGS